jgi:NAD+ kinase
MKLFFHTGDTDEARTAQAALEGSHGKADAKDADMIIVLGGDGTMLDALHRYAELGKPFYGMNFGSVGFLMNPYSPDDLKARLEKAGWVDIHPLRLRATDRAGKTYEAVAFNEVSLLRETRQAAKLKISVDGVVRIDELVCDGVLVSTPAGSTAYNLSAHGPILPLSANVLALTPISAFRPRRWRGALLPNNRTVEIDILEADKRPVSATADSQEFRDIKSVSIHQSKQIGCTLMFDPDHHLEERILKEQFLN